MQIRILKIVLLLIISLQGIIYGAHNIANLEQAYGSLAYVMSHQDHVAYPNSAFPAITSPVLIWIGLIIVLIGEFGSGLLGLIGVRHLWQARAASPADFKIAKKYGILGCGIAIATWLGLFIVIGAAYFQMWQTEIGDASFRGAYILVGTNAFVLLFLNMDE